MSPADPGASATSLWHELPALASRPVLDGDLRVDVAVVGAGVVGLTTALLAVERGLEVALVEARQVGSGTSGATTGKFSVQNGMRYGGLRRTHGRGGARAYAWAARAGIDRAEAIVEHHGIACGHQRTRSHLAVTTDARVAELEVEASAAADAGLRTSWGWGETDLPIRARAVLTFQDELQVHPLAYLRGLADAFVAAGGRLYEASPVDDLRHAGGGGWELQAAGARILAGHVVVATRLPAVGDHRLTFARATPVGGSAIAGVPGTALPDATALVMGTATWSVRASRWPTGDERLVVVGPDAVWEGGPRTSDAVERWAAAHWPDLAVTHRWFAQDQGSADDLPLIGRIRDGSVWTATGFGKWGLALGTYAAERIVAGITREDVAPQARFFEPRRTQLRGGLTSLVSDNLKVAGRWLGGRLRRVEHELRPLEPGEGRVRRIRHTLVAEARDRDGTLHTLDARCTHLGCPVSWNEVAVSWDCRCHGARFAPDGAVLEAPATEPLAPFDPTQKPRS